MLADKPDKSTLMKTFKEAFRKGVRVIARATPYDKYLLVKTLLE